MGCVVGFIFAYATYIEVLTSRARNEVDMIYRYEVDRLHFPPVISRHLESQFVELRNRLGPVASYRLGTSGIDLGLYVTHTQVFVKRRGRIYVETIMGYRTPANVSSLAQ